MDQLNNINITDFIENIKIWESKQNFKYTKSYSVKISNKSIIIKAPKKEIIHEYIRQNYNNKAFYFSVTGIQAKKNITFNDIDDIFVDFKPYKLVPYFWLRCKNVTINNHIMYIKINLNQIVEIQLVYNYKKNDNKYRFVRILNI